VLGFVVLDGASADERVVRFDGEEVSRIHGIDPAPDHEGPTAYLVVRPGRAHSVQDRLENARIALEHELIDQTQHDAEEDL